jgi:PAS domain S-box-containing protein
VAFAGVPEMQALLDATVDAVILIDHRGHIETFNRSGERLFGWRAEEVIGRNVSMLMTERDRDSHDAYMHRYMNTGVPHIIGIGREVDARRKDGSVFPVFLSVGRIHGSGPAPLRRPAARHHAAARGDGGDPPRARPRQHVPRDGAGHPGGAVGIDLRGSS